MFLKLTACGIAIILAVAGCASVEESAALRALQPQHRGGILGKSQRSTGHGVMILAGAGGVTGNQSSNHLFV